MEGSMETSRCCLSVLDFPCSLSEHPESMQIQWCPSAAWSKTKEAFGWNGRSRFSLPTAVDIRRRLGIFFAGGKRVFLFMLICFGSWTFKHDHRLSMWLPMWCFILSTSCRDPPKDLAEYSTEALRALFTCGYGECVRAWCVCRKDHNASLET